jgi:hypothetical protein
MNVHKKQCSLTVDRNKQAVGPDWLIQQKINRASLFGSDNKESD